MIFSSNPSTFASHVSALSAARTRAFRVPGHFDFRRPMVGLQRLAACPIAPIRTSPCCLSCSEVLERASVRSARSHQRPSQALDHPLRDRTTPSCVASLLQEAHPATRLGSFSLPSCSPPTWGVAQSRLQAPKIRGKSLRIGMRSPRIGTRSPRIGARSRRMGGPSLAFLRALEPVSRSLLVYARSAPPTTKPPHAKTGSPLRSSGVHRFPMIVRSWRANSGAELDRASWEPDPLDGSPIGSSTSARDRISLLSCGKSSRPSLAISRPSCSSVGG